ncbi:hypothetical protein AJ80_08968 [Polytolypa hystricis UAMH7299]|uniref:AAA+ ATPase domain-containing protein n=1 Tax=Polytolypa hystricis (strain UAMH7299) TaxID=1447883 RepID=A0A2B7WZ39_POLH7|nr:hypothetical protein AJ80_08968 [Polytolypa hystricis UAMH7299]
MPIDITIHHGKEHESSSSRIDEERFDHENVAITISRDQTAASNFKNEQPLAVQSLPFSTYPFDPFWYMDRESEEIAQNMDKRARLETNPVDQADRFFQSFAPSSKKLKRKASISDEDGDITTSPPINMAPTDNLRRKLWMPNSTPLAENLSTASCTQQSTGPPLQIRHDSTSMEGLGRSLTCYNTIDGSSSTQAHLARIAELEKENSILKAIVEEAATPPRMQVLHYLSSAQLPNLGEPYWIPGPDGGYALKAEHPVGDLDMYLHRYNEIAFVVHKYYDESVPSHLKLRRLQDKEVLSPPKPIREAITLVSDAMRSAVEAFLKRQPNFRQYFPEFSFDDYIPAPYTFWYQYRKTLTLLELQPSQRKLMRLLSRWIESNYGKYYALADSLFANSQVSPRTVQYLIKPGDVLVSKEAGYVQAHLATSWASQSSLEDTDGEPDSLFSNPTPKNRKWRWKVQTWTYEYNGTLYRINSSLEVTLCAEDLDDEANIKELDIVPLHFIGEDVQNKLRLRGWTVWSCRHKRLVSYQDGNDPLKDNRERLMVDFSTYKQLHPDSAVFNTPQTRNSTTDNRVMEENEPPESPNVYLFPPTITGYILRQKKWVDLDVDLIRDVVWNKGAFRDLVIDPDTKELVQALITNQLESEKGTDIIRGKGNGLIMLLHGGPGTGKTFTAETVAEMAEKPLFRVTCGDIGTQPEEVEKYLEYVLHLGKIWGCVVLLDEADVFLEERSLTDLRRNALVSVFLRVLEYYDGILILTSNRVGTFDEAFKSRIQLALHYESLNKSQRLKIWRNFFAHLRSFTEENIDFDDIDCALQELVGQELNGRQIRNAITTARQLAKFNGVTMSSEHLKRVIKVSRKFDTYLNTVKEGFTDDQIARDGGLR